MTRIGIDEIKVKEEERRGTIGVEEKGRRINRRKQEKEEGGKGKGEN